VRDGMTDRARHSGESKLLAGAHIENRGLLDADPWAECGDGDALLW
jgi:hypothetical protein